MATMYKFKRILYLIVLFLVFSCKSSELSQQQASILLHKIWDSLISTDMVMTNIYESSYHSEGEDFWGTGLKYLLHNGSIRMETNRGNGRTGVGLWATPPACGWWYWQEDKTLFSSPTAVANKVIFLPAYFIQIPHLIYGMTLPERFKSGRYTLQKIQYHGYRCLQLTSYYSDPDSVVGKIPISHFFHDQELMDFLDQILDERYPITSEVPDGDKKWILQAAEYYRYREQFKKYYIRKIELFFDGLPEKLHLYGYAIYDSNNRKFKERHWKLAENLVKLDDNYFLPPRGSDIKNTTGDSFGSEVLKSYGIGPGPFKKFIYSIPLFFKSIGKFVSGIFTSAGMLLEYFGIFLLERGWIITLAIAIFSICFAITLKIKQNR